MQIQLQAFSRRSGSLRTAIARDLSRPRQKSRLTLEKIKDPARNPGWTKLTAQGCPGALNIEWDASAHMLLARAISKQGNTPHKLMGVFLDYLIERHGRRITSVNIQLR